MLRLSAASTGDAATAWRLLSEPSQWHRWAPHIRGARGLGSPEVQPGRRGAVLLGLWLPVPAQITGKEPGRSWDWRIGPVDMRHAVEPSPDGCAVSVEIAAPAALEVMLVAAYGPLVDLLVRHLARIAAVSA